MHMRIIQVPERQETMVIRGQRGGRAPRPCHGHVGPASAGARERREERAGDLHFGSVWVPAVWELTRHVALRGTD